MGAPARVGRVAGTFAAKIELVINLKIAKTLKPHDPAGAATAGGSGDRSMRTGFGVKTPKPSASSSFLEETLVTCGFPAASVHQPSIRARGA